MEFAYSVCFLIFSQKTCTFRSKFLKISMYAISETIILAQSIQFFWYPNLPIKDWENFSAFWNIINLPSTDVLAARLDLIREYIIFEITLIATLAFGIFCICLLKLLKKNVPRLILYPCRVISVFLCDLFFIPSCILLFVLYKYSSKKIEYINEYPNNIKGEILDFGDAGKSLAIILLILIVVFSFFYETCEYEIRHNPDEVFSDGKIHPKADILSKTVAFANCYMMTNLQLLDYETYLIAVLFMYSLSTLAFIYYLPYYSRYLNFLKIFVNLDCLGIIVFFWFGFRLNNAGVTFLLGLIMQITLLFIAYRIITFRQSKIIHYSSSQYKSFEAFELSIRGFLKDGSLSSSLLPITKKNLKYSKNKLIPVLQAYYSTDILENCTLGLNKIFNTSHKGLNIFTNYQIYKCKEIMISSCKKLSETYNFFTYFIDFDEIKRQDRKFCEVYFKFFGAVIENKLGLSQIKKQVNEIMGMVESLKEGYEKLKTRFPDALEAKQMHGSLLLNLLSDLHQGQRIMNRYSFYAARNSRKLPNSISKFTLDRCFIVVSGNKFNRGQILFHNKNFISLFGYPQESIKDLNIKTLIPKAYANSHFHHMKKFLKNATSHIVFNRAPLPLLDSDNFLHECLVSIECIGYENSVNFIIAIDSLGYKKREYALIYDNGYMQEHSKYFPALIGANRKYASDSFIQEYIPEINLNDFQDNVPKEISFYNKQTMVMTTLKAMNKIFSVKKSNFRIFYLSSNTEKISSWNDDNFFAKDENDDEELDIPSIFTDKYDENNSTVPKRVEIRDNKSLAYQKSVDRSRQNSTSTSTSVMSTKEIKSFKKSILVLKFARYILLLLIIVLIAASIGILIYISQEVSHSNSLTALNHLNNQAFYLTQLALVLRCLHVENVANISLIYSIDNAQEVVNDLIMYQDKLLEDYDSWSYCPSSKIIKEPIVPYWVLEKSPVMKYANLHKVIELIIENSESMIEKLKNKENYSKEMFMIFFNCIGSSLKDIIATIEDLIDCELDRVQSLSNQKTILLLGGVCVVGTSICILALYLITIDKHLNALWQFLDKRMRNGFLQIRQLISERLSQYHDLYEIPDSEMDGSAMKKKETLKFRHSLWYLMRFSLIFLFAAGFYIVLITVFYDVICRLLEVRPQLVSGLALRRIQLTEISLFTLENEAIFTGLSIYQTYPFFLNMKPPGKEVIDIINSLKKTYNVINDPKSKSLMSEKLKTMILEKIPGASTFLSMGSYRGVTYCVIESLFMVFNRVPDFLKYVVKYLNEVIEFSNSTNELAILSDSDSKLIIEEMMNNMIYFTVLCLTVLIVAFFIFYYPLINKEISVLKKLAKLLVILPSSSVSKQKGDFRSLTLVNSS